jgi:hypothetical protein
VKKQRPQRVNIRPCVNRSASFLLRRDVTQRPDWPLMPLVRGVFRFGQPRFGQLLGDAEIDDVRLPLAVEQHVLRLQVPMHHALPMGVVDGPGDRLDDLDPVGQRNLTLLEVIVEPLPLHELHGVVQRRRGELRVVQRGDVRVPQPRDEVHLILEVRGQQRSLAEQDLERLGPLLGMVNRLVHDAEAPLADLTDDRVVWQARIAPGGELPKQLTARLALFEYTLRFTPPRFVQLVLREGLDQLALRAGLGTFVRHRCTVPRGLAAGAILSTDLPGAL